MPKEITREILESFLKCEYKSHLKLMGEKGISSDFENVLRKSESLFRQKAIQKVHDKSTKSDVLHNVTLNHQMFKHGAPWIINGEGIYAPFSILFDALKKEDGRSKISNFHYIPVLFVQCNIVHVFEKRLLALYGLLLGGVQGRQPRKGIIIHGQQLQTIKLKLSPNVRKMRNLLEKIKDIQKGWEPPLMLNDHCHICEFQQRCLQQATEKDDLSLLRGMTEKQINMYHRRGIFTVSQLSHTYRARKINSSKTNKRHDFALQAMAIRDKQVFITEIQDLKHESVRIFFDIEGIPDSSFNYLIGALICTPNSETQYSFWADDLDQQTVILDNFLNLLDKFERFHVFHYGAYEVKFLKRMREKTALTEIIDKLLQNSTNILSVIYGRIYFPVYSNGLKHIAPLLGFSWSDNQASGINSIIWRHKWDKNKNPVDKNRLITYNSDDCEALKVVTDFIFSTDNKSDIDKSTSVKDLPISYVHNIRRTYSRPDWRTPQFMITDLDYINRCSYFDYQREKIYVRSNKNIAKQQAKRSKNPKRIKATKRTVVIECSACPYCGSSAITKWRWGLKRRKCLDLKITKNCVRRVVKECAAFKYHCGECEKKFFPEQYTQLYKYGHSLKSWAMYEYVGHRASFKSLEGTFRDLFDLPIHYNHISIMKRIMANYYQETVEGLRRRLVAGSFLHADETQVKLQRVGKGYVWAFTNLEEVLYAYTRSRDGHFLIDMFDGFSGVLISDFYAVYDWAHCAQQKCLIHLIRDLNNELLRNPFDEEYKNLVAEFGSILRRIIASVDRYGLKRRHLAKHQREVDKFLSKLSNQCFRSSAAQSAQERLIRYKDRLFTFIKYDGVPWNNNNAEYAIKKFAHYREITNGHVTEAGIADYLVLLSICQTCKYKGINFLKFLLSGELDIVNYRERSGLKPKLSDFGASLLEQAFFDIKIRNELSHGHNKRDLQK